MKETIPTVQMIKKKEEEEGKKKRSALARVLSSLKHFSGQIMCI